MEAPAAGVGEEFDILDDAVRGFRKAHPVSISASFSAVSVVTAAALGFMSGNLNYV